MPDEAIMAAALVLTAFFGRFLYKHQKDRKTGKQRFIEKAKAAGNCTEGEYEDAKVHLGVDGSDNSHFRSDTLVVKYRYTVDGRVYRKSMPFQSPGKAGIDFPSYVQVYYDPRDPKKAVCPEEATWAHQHRSGCLVSIAGTLLFLGASFYLLRYAASLLW